MTTTVIVQPNGHNVLIETLNIVEGSVAGGTEVLMSKDDGPQHFYVHSTASLKITELTDEQARERAERPMGSLEQKANDDRVSPVHEDEALAEDGVKHRAE